ncbi:potassium/proton antiporter [Clostridium cylindrosporum]|uniref:K(+)/H(+) antiporter NhaP2 n=1 Tax=Clostridium cylindrosporum DSM 605 TaxID=1121307 RepID=A0A0J8D7S0_CLOCY|nr:potassium/proton antiporter [Clostridium cylindrosporum]KMT22085.1 K(+)/H(+) antiporter NhaP2 [Clostridium cylindrosporum DSM 605]
MSVLNSPEKLILLFSTILILGVFSTKFSNKLGVPSLVFYIGVGMLLNLFIFFNNAKLTQLISTIALVIILFDGGFKTKWSKIKKIIPSSTSLATLGVLVTTLITAIFSKLILGFDWLNSLLLGSIVSSTDAAAVFAVLGDKNIKPKVSSTLEIESGSNDPMAIFLTISFISLIKGDMSSISSLIFFFFWQMGIGTLLGLLFGKISLYIINKIDIDSSGLACVLALSLGFLTFSATTSINASGFLAVYIMAIYLGNNGISYGYSVEKFHDGLAWVMQISMFVILGHLVFPKDLLQYTTPALLLSLVLMLIARPIGVFISTIFSDFTLKEKVFISWAGLKGAVPIVLGTYPMVSNLPNSSVIFNVVFFTVLTSALIQGYTLNPFAKKLGLLGEDIPEVHNSLELISTGKSKKDMIQVYIGKDSASIGKTLMEIELPEKTLVSAIIRNDDIITPVGSTTIEYRDVLFILTPKEYRESTKSLLA